jgi:hypothetical protein
VSFAVAEGRRRFSLLVVAEYWPHAVWRSNDRLAIAFVALSPGIPSLGFFISLFFLDRIDFRIGQRQLTDTQRKH